MKFAAIDIGTNAVRLLLSQVLEVNGQTLFKKESLVRMPLRLGGDVFTIAIISPEKEDRLIRTMVGFKHLIDTYEPVCTMACATSAMREAGNSRSILKKIQANSGISVEIVDGKREAEILYSNTTAQIMESGRPCLYIDVGGGSTEIGLLENYRSVASNSFDIGTVRILEGLDIRDRWRDMKKWMKAVAGEYSPITAIGSGGNINKLYRIAGVKDNKPMTYKKLYAIYNALKACDYQERLSRYRLRPDRADVIVPAADIFLSVMKWAGVKEIHVPQIGLSDGLVHIMYQEYKQKAEEKKKQRQYQTGFSF